MHTGVQRKNVSRLTDARCAEQNQGAEQRQERSEQLDMLEVRGSRLVVHLPEELDHHYTEEIREEIDEAVKNYPVDEVEFDFSKTAFMDSAGIGMLLGRHKIMKALNGQITVSHMNGQIRRILSMSGIRSVINF